MFSTRPARRWAPSVPPSPGSNGSSTAARPVGERLRRVRRTSPEARRPGPTGVPLQSELEGEHSFGELLDAADGAGPRFSSPFFPSLRGRDRSALPLLIYVPGLDGVGCSAYGQLEALGSGFQLESFMIPLGDRSDFAALLEIFTSYLVDEVGPQVRGRMVYLLGEAFGSLLVLAAARECKDVVDRIVLVNPVTGLDASAVSTAAALLGSVPRQLYPVVSGLTAPALVDPFGALSRFANGSSPAAERPGRLLQGGLKTLEALSAVAERLSPEVVEWKLEVLRQGLEHVEPIIHKVPQRTLILASESDGPFQSARESERLEGLMLRPAVRTLSGAGHAALRESGTDFLQILKDEGFYVTERRMTSQNGGRLRLNSFGEAHPIELPTWEEIRRAESVVGEAKRTSSPVFLSTLPDGSVVEGLDGVPDSRPLLVVGNHALMALDMSLLVYELLRRKGFLVRGLAHPAVVSEAVNVVKPPEDEEISLFTRFLVQLFNPRDAYKLYTTYGAVPVSPKNMHRLLSMGERVLLYPGGVPEGLRPKHQKYEVIWPERSEFVRMAAKFGSTVVTVASVGVEDGVEQIYDTLDMARMPFLRDSVRKFVDASPNARKTLWTKQEDMREERLIPPITFPAKPARQYFLFGKPGQLTPEIASDKEKSEELYRQFKVELETSISYLIEKREDDPYKDFEKRMLYEAICQRQAPTFKPCPVRDGDRA